MPLYSQVVLFGDSLFQLSSTPQDGFSFQAALQDHCMRRLDVINRGFSGYNTTDALGVLPDLFPPPSATTPKIDYILVLLGANDACLPIPTNSQQVPLEQYKQNLRDILTHPTIRAHNPKILLVSPPPLDEIRMLERDLEKGHGQASRSAAVSKTYSDAALSIAAEVPGVVPIDLHEAVMRRAESMTIGSSRSSLPLGHPGGERGGLEVLIPDGLHLGGEGYRVLFELVKPHIGPFDQSREDYRYPDWKILNPGSLG
ncbi:SGNH hydrolase-type esterase domain-containing protein [Colletotrichum godetiae]|uniref:SGNH hydrolase-type esterase domain-containing protein n=1 Tax=Colletotrichum godetiae TaxID=1209918 RepID=A0AAJ0ET18_9PEZI|nr:SGNH hydrolase-type esterase domain-containing protein [Colletotrichum godetiae]KAK1660048.1 SGNH hydrolase-type esterase domain-containing protein [Colletotrichum godetiae]